MIPEKKPVITVVHSLPGRVRVRLSHEPNDPERLMTAVRVHPGMGTTRYTSQTRSLLVEFDPHAISQEEITLRMAFQCALDRGGSPVRLLAAPEHSVLENSAILAAIGLATSLGVRWVNGARKGPTALEWSAGVGTAWSIAEHAWKELRQRGYFDPEALTLVYLLTALFRGRFLTASAVTWLSTFGRHLIEVPPTGVEVRALEVAGPTGEGSRHELVVGPDTEAPEHMRVLGALQGVLKYAMSGGGAHGVQSLWEELRHVSRIHGEILEGFGRADEGIPIRFR